MQHERLAEILDRHARALQLLAATRCASAEDCVQEAFLELVRQKRPPDDPVAWLYRVVRNKAINAGRSESARRRRESTWSQSKPGWFEPTVDEALSADELQKALASLDPDDREIVVARIWGKLTLEETGELVSLSISAVHRRYAAALQQLRAWLEAHDVESTTFRS
jgi:RNA polymerase sigma-70 factor (ECF subfamily)